MDARAVDDAAQRLRELRHVEWERLGLGAMALALAVAASEVRPALALPLLVGGLALGALGIAALWRHWDLLERLAGERDAHAIPEVRAYASREATLERRQELAAGIRRQLEIAAVGAHARPTIVAQQLEGLATELEDPALTLDPSCAVVCARLLSDVGSPLLDSPPPPDELRAWILRIRAGFRPT